MHAPCLPCYIRLAPCHTYLQAGRKGEGRKGRLEQIRQPALCCSGLHWMRGTMRRFRSMCLPVLPLRCSTFSSKKLSYALFVCVMLSNLLPTSGHGAHACSGSYVAADTDLATADSCLVTPHSHLVRHCSHLPGRTWSHLTHTWSHLHTCRPAQTPAPQASSASTAS
jgi:hypothetical protein